MATIRFTNTGKIITQTDYVNAVQVVKSVDTLFKPLEREGLDVSKYRAQFMESDTYKEAQETITLYRTYRPLVLEEHDDAEYHIKVIGDIVEIKVIR